MKIRKTNTQLEIIVPINKYWFHVLPWGIIGITVIIAISVLIVLFSIALFEGRFYKYFRNDMLVPFLAAPIVLNYASWLWFGKERLLFTENSVEYIRTNGLIRIRKKLEATGISSILPMDPNYMSGNFMQNHLASVQESQRAMFWIDMGKIKFRHKGDSVNLFNGLENESEIETVIAIMKEEIAKRIAV